MQAAAMHSESFYSDSFGSFFSRIFPELDSEISPVNNVGVSANSLP